MAEEEFDVEALLEAPYINGSSSKLEEPKSVQGQSEASKKRSRSRDRHQPSSNRDGDHDRDKTKRDGDRDKDRNDRDKNRSDRNRDRDRDDKVRDRDKDVGARDRDRDRDRRDGDHDRDRRRDDRRGDNDRRGNDRRRDDDRRDRDRRDDRRRSRSRSRDRRRNDRSNDDRHRRSRDRSRNRSPSPATKKKMDVPDFTPEERDARTVICMQLASRICSEDLEEFFSSVGKVTDVRLVTDRKRKSKGIAYIEFLEVESVPLAIALTGQRLLGVPIVVQLSHAEKNRLAAMQAAAAAAAAQAAGEATTNSSSAGSIPGAAKLYVGSLHFNINEEMLRAIFEPFGKLLDVSIVKDQKTGQSQGFAFITFRNAEDASVALVQMNGFPLAGRPLKVGRSERSAQFPDIGEVDKIGTFLSSPMMASTISDPLAAATAAAAGITTGLEFGMNPGLGMGSMAGLGGLNPMAGLGVGLDPTAALLGLGSVAGLNSLGATQNVNVPPITTECLMVSNMFDPTQQKEAGWDNKLCDDVVRECARNSSTVTHIAVDAHSPQGNVYVRCETPAAALIAVNILHGRFFDGRLVTVGYVPSDVYHSLFPDALSSGRIMGSGL